MERNGSLRKNIKLDIDIPYKLYKDKVFPLHKLVITKALEGLGIKVRDIVARKSANGYVHVHINLVEPITDLDAIILALCLGSDHKRFMVNYERLRDIGKSFDYFFNYGYAVKFTRADLEKMEKCDCEICKSVREYIKRKYGV